MKNGEVLEFASGLNALRSELTGRDFAKAVVLNQRKIADFVDAINEARKPSKEMQKYFDDFNELKKEYAEKDKEGNPIIESRREAGGISVPYYVIPDSENPESEFFKKREALIADNKETIDAHTNMLKEWTDEFLDKDSGFEPYKIDEDLIPNNVNVDEMKFLIYMINE